MHLNKIRFPSAFRSISIHPTERNPLKLIASPRALSVLDVTFCNWHSVSHIWGLPLVVAEWKGRRMDGCMNFSAPNFHVPISARTYQLPVSLCSLWPPQSLPASYFSFKVTDRPCSHGKKDLAQFAFSSLPKSQGGKTRGKEDLNVIMKLRVHALGLPGTYLVGFLSSEQTDT